MMYNIKVGAALFFLIVQIPTGEEAGHLLLRAGPGQPSDPNHVTLIVRGHPYCLREHNTAAIQSN